jgi:hypothetical protein
MYENNPAEHMARLQALLVVLTLVAIVRCITIRR